MKEHALDMKRRKKPYHKFNYDIHPQLSRYVGARVSVQATLGSFLSFLYSVNRSQVFVRVAECSLLTKLRQQQMLNEKQDGSIIFFINDERWGFVWRFYTLMNYNMNTFILFVF